MAWFLKKSPFVKLKYNYLETSCAIKLNQVIKKNVKRNVNGEHKLHIPKQIHSCSAF